MHSRRLKFLVILTCFLSVLPSIGRSQKYPDKPMRLVVPYAAGGGTDILARSLSAKVSDVLGQTIVVDNKAGAGGNIGADIVAKASPDGYTLLMAANTIPINAALQKLPFDPVHDFVPVAMLASAPMVLVVHPSVKANNVRELIALAKATPGKLNYSNAGNGTPQHLAACFLCSLEVLWAYRFVTCTLELTFPMQANPVLQGLLGEAQYLGCDGRRLPTYSLNSSLYLARRFVSLVALS